MQTVEKLYKNVDNVKIKSISFESGNTFFIK